MVDVTANVLEALDPRARAAAADALVSFSKAFGDAMQPLVANVLDVVEACRYDSGRTQLAAAVSG